MTLFLIKVHECGRLLAVLFGGSFLTAAAASVGGAIPATFFGLLTTAGLYSGQSLATWRIRQELSRHRPRVGDNP